MKKYLLFDFDGVIADSFDSAFIINSKIRPGVTVQGYRDYFNGNVYDAVAKQVEKPLGEESVKSFFAEYETAINKVSCINGMPEVIKSLGKDYEMIIVSSTIGGLIEGFLEKYDIRSSFSKIMGAELESNKSKKIRMIFEEFSISEHDCLFITDTLGDIKEARMVNVNSVAVSWGYHSVATLETGNPLAIVYKPAELLDFITKVF